MNINLMHFILSLEQLFQRLVLHEMIAPAFSLAFISHGKTNVLLVYLFILLVNQWEVFSPNSSVRNVNNFIV
jgi:hypothetical protein